MLPKGCRDALNKDRMEHSAGWAAPRARGQLPTARGQLPARRAHPRCSRPDSGGSRWSQPAAPPPDPSPLTSPHAPHSPWRSARAPPPWPPPCCAPPPLLLLSAVPARGAGPGVTPFQPPSRFSGGDRGRIGGCRGRPRAVPRQEGWRGARRLLRAAGGGRTRQAASPLKAATTSPARGRTAHAPRACAAPLGSASRLPSAQARCGLLRAWLYGSPKGG